MTRTCTVSGCGKAATGYSKLCTNHSKTKRRHGHPLQRPTRRTELKPYEKAIKDWLRERASPDAYAILISKLDAMATTASVYCERAPHGRPYQRHQLQASDTALRVHKENDPRDIIIRMLAMGYLHHFDPRRFQSDEAFRFQVARQFRSLTDGSVGVTWDNEKNRTKRVYRDVPPRTLRALWSLILETGILHYGSQLGAAIEAERSRREYADAEVARALLGTTAFGQHIARRGKEPA